MNAPTHMSVRADMVTTWRPALFVLAGGLILLGFLFRTEVIAAVDVWNSSTAYNHCFLILPIALWLAWHRRELLAGLTARPTLLALPAGFVLGAIWFVADRLGIMEGRQLVAIGFVELLFFSVLGWPLYRALIVPLLYLFFLVPFGGFLVAPLQSFTTQFVVHGLNLLGIPNFNEGNTIEIPQGVFYIAEACAGLRFLIAAAAFSVLYACVIYRSSLRRLLFILAAVCVPVIANGLRALGIVWLGHALGSATAAATDHVLYGYLFFSIVLLLLILLGLLFRDDRQAVPWRPAIAPGPPTTPAARHGWPAAALVIVLAAIFPLLALRIDDAAAKTRLAAPVAFPGCQPADSPAGFAPLSVAGGALAHFACANGTLALTVALFPPRSDPRLVLDAERILSERDANEAQIRTLTIHGAEPQNWVLVAIPEPPAATASALWIDGRPASGNLRSRLRLAMNSLLGGKHAPLVVSLKMVGPSRVAAERIAAFLTAGGVPGTLLAEWTTTSLRNTHSASR